MTAFEEFGVLPELGKAIDDMEWTLPTDVQAEAIPLILGGGDVLMAAETGSGKTGAFCLPIIQIVWETLKDIQEGKTSSKLLLPTSSSWTMSFFDRTDALAVTPDGLRCQSRDQNVWHGCRATKGVHSKGAYYYEATVTDEGLCRVGWSAQAARLDLGTDRLGFGFGGTGKKSNAKQFDDYGSAYGINDVIGCLLNLNNGEIRYTKNGEDLGVAFQLDPPRRSATYFPAVVLKNAEMSFNFGDTPFKYEIPTGYVAVNKAPKECMKHNVVSATSAADSKPVNNAPQAIIIEPSRELAEQTCNQITKFKKYLEAPQVRELLVVGGVNIKDQISQLNAGIDIVVGTPGRLEDLIQGGYLALTHCRFFVLDEADGLLKSGYGELIERLHRQIPKITSDGRRLQMVVCSATLHAFEVKKMAEKLMHFPTWVDLKGEDAVPDTVHHVVVKVDPQTDRSWETLTKASTRRRVTFSQLEVLWEFLEVNRDIALGFNKSAQARDHAKRNWQTVTTVLNSQGEGSIKDWKGWSNYWIDYKAKLKKKIAAMRFCLNRNGGDPSDGPVLNEIEAKFLEIIENDSSTGVQNKQVEPYPENLVAITMEDQQDPLTDNIIKQERSASVEEPNHAPMLVITPLNNPSKPDGPKILINPSMQERANINNQSERPSINNPLIFEKTNTNNPSIFERPNINNPSIFESPNINNEFKEESSNAVISPASRSPNKPNVHRPIRSRRAMRIKPDVARRTLIEISKERLEIDRRRLGVEERKTETLVEMLGVLKDIRRKIW